jgi:hypothetical protein
MAGFREHGDNISDRWPHYIFLLVPYMEHLQSAVRALRTTAAS